MKKKIYTLCFDVDVTYEKNPWKNRKRIASAIQHELSNFLGSKVYVSIAEMQHGLVEVDSLIQTGDRK